MIFGGNNARLNDPGMRIVWQLLQAGIASFGSSRRLDHDLWSPRRQRFDSRGNRSDDGRPVRVLAIAKLNSG